MWSILSSMYILHCKAWHKQFLVDMGERLREKFNHGMHHEVGFVTFDNCSYFVRIVFQRAARNGRFLHTINWFTVPLPPDLFPSPLPFGRGGWHNGSWTYAARELFDPRSRTSASKKREVWHFFMSSQRRGCSILAHLAVPIRVAVVASLVFYMPPIFNVGTASYKDVEKVLAAIQLALGGFVLIAVCGDGLSYDRVYRLKAANPFKYQWVLLLPGEFHFTVHVLMAVHRLWYKKLVAHLLKPEAGNSTPRHGVDDKTIKRKWTSVEQYDHCAPRLCRPFWHHGAA
jgi:hypothetical protein